MSVTRRQSLLEVPTSQKLLRFLGGLVMLSTLALAFGVGWQAALEVAQGMLRAGWGAALKASSPAELILRCYGDLTGNCTEVMNGLWQKALPLDTLRMVVAGGFVLGMIPFLIRPHRPRKLPGQGRWASASDLKGYLGEGTGWYGLFEGKPLRVPSMERRTGTLVVGKPGGGKTTGYYQPNLLLDARDGWSAIVFDLKWPDEGGLMEAIRYYSHFGRAVYAYTPFAPGSARIALLEGAENPQEASNIADIIVPRLADGGAEFYANLERMLLAGLIWVEGQEGRYSLRHILELLRQGKEEIKAYAEVRPHLKDRIGAVMQTREDIIAGVVAGLAGRLALFENDHLDRSSLPGAGAVPWPRLFSEPSLLYIGIPQEHLEGGKATALLWLVKRILDREIHRAAARNGGTLKALTSVYLDEFTAFGKLPGIEDNLKTMRSRGAAFHVSVQNLANGRSVYGRDVWESIQGTFGQQVYLLERLSEEDRKWLARTLGYETVVGYSRSASKMGFLSGSEGEGEREEARFLLSAEEMREVKKGETVVILDGKPPVRTYLGGMWEKKHPLHGLYEKARKAVPAVRAGAARDRAYAEPQPRPASSSVEERQPEPERQPVELQPEERSLVQEASDPRSLEAYIRRLASTLPVFQRYYHKKTTTGIRFVLPAGFPPPETAWVREGWIEVRGKEELSVNLTSKGLETLEKTFVAALVRWCRVREWARRQNQERQSLLYMSEEEAETVLREYAKQLPTEGGRVRVEISLEALGDARA
ncbi:type IV secretory system conjugative DNA transfer family protein [Meiothermus ruber]|uniref:Type IV secretory pathway VirD4 protein n=1 Tax=Meiothermus ruber (strain ATCC 35948 / DSM 1279 / VKM B-1258 / 21) TaxID=504728 RepID=D3PMX2_MEIRD|nr:type IV secretory system conjugative DNA transfer family protein [Meiothermus ruber]ADD27297.1 Type IV secretory pathway VirD4 protein [Meiothermus ruber DSM 1279]AGK03751.1 Type IV secretory pathway VirD4 protein [Meiothermus ruber DSM 1279]